MKIMFTHQQTQINYKNNKKDMKAKQGSSKSKKDKISPINASENWHRVMIFRSKYKIYMVVKLKCIYDVTRNDWFTTYTRELLL